MHETSLFQRLRLPVGHFQPFSAHQKEKKQSVTSEVLQQTHSHIHAHYTFMHVRKLHCARACLRSRQAMVSTGGQGSHDRPPAGRPESRGPPSPERGGPCGEGRVTCPWHIDIFHWHIDDFHCHNDIFHTTGVQWRAGGGSSEAFMIPEGGGTLN